MLLVCLGAKTVFLSASWRQDGALLAFVGAKLLQDGANMVKDSARMLPGWPEMVPKRSEVALRRIHDRQLYQNGRTFQRSCKTNGILRFFEELGGVCGGFSASKLAQRWCQIPLPHARGGSNGSPRSTLDRTPSRKAYGARHMLVTLP